MNLKIKHVGIFIPIKKTSERIRGKNFQVIAGKPLYQRSIDTALKVSVEGMKISLFVDTDSPEIQDYAAIKGLRVIDREPYLAQDDANGNDLLNYHVSQYPQFDIYCQMFCTAPFLKAETINWCLMNPDLSIPQDQSTPDQNDSLFLVRAHKNWFWTSEGMPINYRPSALPRSQDSKCVYEETTGLYIIKREALLKYRCRIGANPYFKVIEGDEAIDVDNAEDLEYAKFRAEKH